MDRSPPTAMTMHSETAGPDHRLTPHVPPLSIRSVILAACDTFAVTAEELLGPSRRHPLVRQRQVAVAAAARLTGRSKAVIGREFGGRDHSTVCHAIAVVAADPELSKHCDQVARLAATKNAETVDWARAVPFRSHRGLAFRSSRAA